MLVPDGYRYGGVDVCPAESRLGRRPRIPVRSRSLVATRRTTVAACGTRLGSSGGTRNDSAGAVVYETSCWCAPSGVGRARPRSPRRWRSSPPQRALPSRCPSSPTRGWARLGRRSAARAINVLAPATLATSALGASRWIDLRGRRRDKRHRLDREGCSDRRAHGRTRPGGARLGPLRHRWERAPSSTWRGTTPKRPALCAPAWTSSRHILTGVLFLDPQRVVIGGGMSRASDLLLDPLRARLHAVLAFSPEIMHSSFGADASLLGAIEVTRRGVAEAESSHS